MGLKSAGTSTRSDPVTMMMVESDSDSGLERDCVMGSGVVILVNAREH